MSQKPHSSKEAERFADLVAEHARRSTDALALFEPLPTQFPFFKSEASIRIVRGGNRSGKSRCSYAEFARAMTGRDPYHKFPTHRPLLGYVISYDHDVIGRVAWKMLFGSKGDRFRRIRDEVSGEWRMWRPWEELDKAREAETKPAGPLITPRMIDPNSWVYENKRARQFTSVRLKLPGPMDGTEIRAYSSRAQPAMGDPVDVVLIDEDLYDENWIGEMQARLSDNRGKLIWSAWPKGSNNALVTLSDQAAKMEGMDKPVVQEFVFTYTDNPFIPPEAKQERYATWSTDERRARDYGEFLTSNILMYPTFSKKVHCIPSGYDTDFDKKWGHYEYKIPRDWSRFIYVDPGHAVQSAMFIAVPPPENEFGDIIVAYDEVSLERKDANEFALAISRKSQGVMYQRFVMDAHAGRTTTMGSAVGRNIRSIYADAFQRHGLRSAETGSSFADGSDKVAARAMEVRNWLAIREGGGPKFYCFRDTTPCLQDQMARYKKRIGKQDGKGDIPIVKGNDMCVVLEYAAADQPCWAEPKYGEKSWSPAYAMFRRWQEKQNKQQGRDHIDFGSPLVA